MAEILPLYAPGQNCRNEKHIQTSIAVWNLCVTRNSESPLRIYYPLASFTFPFVTHLMLKALSEIFLEWMNLFAKQRVNQRPQNSQISPDHNAT